MRVVSSLLLLAGLAVARPASAMTLEQAWSVAEDGNLELQLAQEQAAQAATLRWQAMSIQLPQLSTNWRYVRNEFEVQLPEELQTCILVSPLGGDPTPIPREDCFENDQAAAFDTEDIFLQRYDVVEGTVSVLLPILRAQAAPGWRAATGIWRAAQADQRRAQQQVRSAVAQAFYGVVQAREGIGVAEANLDVVLRQADLAARQVAAGLEARRAELQAELAVSRARRDLEGAKTAVVRAEQAFAKVVGEAPPADLEVPASIQVPDDPDGALGTARDDRADVEALRLRHRAAQDERLARDLEWVPTIDAFFQEGINALPTALNPNPFQWRVGVQLQWTIFDGGMRIARSRELRARSRAAEILVEQRLRQIDEEVRVAFQDLRRADDALVAVEREVDLATENLDLAEKGYAAGQATFLEVETARVALQASQLALVQERARRDLAAIQVNLAVGDL